MNNERFVVRRSVRLPEATQVERFRRAPELGPRLLFFSGGSALRETSRRLKLFTHNSIHLITPFDSGGSSAALRRAFGMLSLGDLRNRLLALADETQRGAAEVRALFSHRLSKSLEQSENRALIEAMSAGRHEALRAIPAPMRQLVQTDLRMFLERMPSEFDLRGASVGNLLLAGGYLHQSRDIDSLLFLFSKLLEVRGQVRCVADAHADLEATLNDGTRLRGQSRLTGKEHPPIESPVHSLAIVGPEPSDGPIPIRADEASLELIDEADLICFPMGSFYSSLIASVLPIGVGRAIAARRCPKVFIPNTGEDSEWLAGGMLARVEFLLSTLRADLDDEVPTEHLLDAVLLDEDDASYDGPVEVEALEQRGIRVLRAPLRELASDPVRLDPARLVDFLLSLG